MSFHYTVEDAAAGRNAFYSPYTNINQQETIYIRVLDSVTGGLSYSSVSIEVLEKPEVSDETQWLSGCDVNGDGFEDFDLTLIVDGLLQGLTGVTVTFHETQDDAQTGDNPIADATNYRNNIADFQRIFVRVVRDDTGCPTVVPLELYANVVEDGFELTSYEICDDPSGDGVEDFDLNDIQDRIVDNFDGFDFFFYRTEEDRGFHF